MTPVIEPHRVSTHPLLTATAIAAAPLAAIGFARFAYALVLPEMKSDLGWDYTTAGLMTTSIALGYLAGALIAAPVARRVGTGRAYFVGWAVTAVALAATGASRALAILLLTRVIAGVASAVTFVAGAGLAAHLPARGRVGPVLALGLYQTGAGAGIVLSGVVTSPVLSLGGPHAWQAVWLLLASISIVVLAVVFPIVSRAGEPDRTPSASRRDSLARFAPTLGGYFLFGMGYIAYMTFIIAFLQNSGAQTSTITAFWIVLGASAMVGSLAWGLVLGRFRGGWGPAAVLTVTLMGAAIPVLMASPPAAIISGVVFGSSFLATATAVNALARRVMPRDSWTWAIGLLTAAFGIGQLIGPWLTGRIADGPGGIRAGLGLSAAILLVGVVALAMQRERGLVARFQAENDDVLSA